MKLVWTKRALRELDQIFALIAMDSRSAATELVDLVETRTAMLMNHPEIGRPGRSEGTRELVVAGTPYILPYRVRDDRVEILAVIHSSRQWPDQL